MEIDTFFDEILDDTKESLGPNPRPNDDWISDETTVPEAWPPLQ